MIFYFVLTSMYENKYIRLSIKNNTVENCNEVIDMKSMTAYVQIEKIVKEIPISFVLKSYNNRFLDMRISLPFWLNALEPFVREYFSARILRGSVEISLSTTHTNPQCTVSIDREAAKKYNEALSALAAELGTPYTPNLQYIASQQGVLVKEEHTDIETWKPELLKLFELAFYAFDDAKKCEGTLCQKNIEMHIAGIEQAVARIEAERKIVEENFATQLRKKFEELVGDRYDETRILQECAVLLNKYTIEEELVRLHAHLLAIQAEVKKDGAIAKRLDFICQEMNREINTIASKNQSYTIAEQVVSVKEALENIREQLKNLE